MTMLLHCWIIILRKEVRDMNKVIDIYSFRMVCKSQCLIRGNKKCWKHLIKRLSVVNSLVLNHHQPFEITYIHHPHKFSSEGRGREVPIGREHFKYSHRNRPLIYQNSSLFCATETCGNILFQNMTIVTGKNKLTGINSLHKSSITQVSSPSWRCKPQFHGASIQKLYIQQKESKEKHFMLYMKCTKWKVQCTMKCTKLTAQ